MKKKIFMLLAVMLLIGVNAMAQSGNSDSLKGDVNGDGIVDIADINAIINIMAQNGGVVGADFFYIGTTRPTIENYRKLSGGVSTYKSLDDVADVSVSIAAGQTLYMLCPEKWVYKKYIEMTDKNGNPIKFSNEPDTSIEGYVIYKTEVLTDATDVSLIEADYLQISSSTINMMLGYGGAVRIVAGSGRYHVKSSNEDIVTADISLLKDSTFIVQLTTVNIGEATISLTDEVTNITEDIQVVIQNEPDKIEGKYVDLGLTSGTLWATCNVGAEAPEEYGGYFSWGETWEKSLYTISNYWLFSAGNTTDLNDEQDVACVKLGEGWRMPTMEELEELLSCSWSWEKHNGVQGARITGPNGNAIFLPAGTFKENSNSPVEGTYGSYWGRTHANTVMSVYGQLTPCGAELVFGTADYKESFTISDFYFEMGPTGYCHCGRSVRPVYDKTYKPNIPEEDKNNYTSRIVNPNYDNNNYYGWDGTPLSGANPDNNAEHYNKDYDTYQTISNLPKGIYRVGVQGFYRKGNPWNDYSLWNDGDTQNNNALLYATSSVVSVSTPLVQPSSAATMENLVEGTIEVDSGKYIPNDMISTGTWFKNGFYHNYLDIKVGDDGILVIGIKKNKTIDQDWTIIDNWTLFRIGD